MDPSEKTDTATKATASNTSPAIPPTGEPARSAAVTSSAKPYTNVQWVFICIAVFSSAFLYGLDTTITSVVQGTLIERFDSVEKLGWLGIGFPLGSVATLATWAKAYGVFDTKWLYIGSLINFAAGSALCGGAPSMNVLIVGRVWAGAGGAGMYLGYVTFCSSLLSGLELTSRQLNIFSQNSTIEKRALYISGGAFSWGLGSTLGPIVGAAFADSKATWRWVSSFAEYRLPN
jgi:MFS family permease